MGIVLTSRSAPAGVALGDRVLPPMPQALLLFQTDKTGMCLVFPALKKAEFWSYMVCKLLKCCRILWGSALCVRPSMYHNLPNGRPTLFSNERLKECIILFFFFFLSSTYTRKQLTHAYKILTNNFSLINKLMLSLEKFSGTGARRIFQPAL